MIMGSRGQYHDTNRFSSYFEPQYHAEGYVAGVKVLEHNSGANGKLPEYAKTATAYIGVNREGKFTRLRIYENHRPVIDIDLGHPNHHGLNDGDVHVHQYGIDKTGHPVRPRGARPMSRTEHEKYDAIIAEMARRNG